MKTRIISAAAAIVLLAAVLALHKTVVFNIAFALIGSIMVYELFDVFKQKRNTALLVISIAEAAALAVMPRFLSLNDNLEIYILVVLAYIVLSVAILLIEHNSAKDTNMLDIASFCAVCFVSLLVSVAMASISVIEHSGGEFGLENVILILCGAWLADTGAYFAGTFFGKHKLCPNISPKKTVEGLLGGIAADALLFMLIGYIVSLYNDNAHPNYLILAVLGIACSVLSVIGDLFASLIKRHCEVKDFGKIMPGHGGAFDRFDSVVFVAPFMAVCLTWFGVF